MCEQIVNGRFRRILVSIYMYETHPTLDFSAVLWYHNRVKLGCNATVPHGFDSVFPPFEAAVLPDRNRVTVRRRAPLAIRKPEKILPVLPHMCLAVFG